MMFRQAIQTKYLGPTNTKGSRVRATCDAKTRIYNWKSELSTDENHLLAATNLFKELGWDHPNKNEAGALVGGCIGNIYYFVTVEQLASGIIRAWE